MNEEHPMTKVGRMFTAGLSTVALAGAVGAGFAYADPDTTPRGAPPTTKVTASPAASPTGSAGPRAENRSHRGLLRRTIHGEATLGGKEHRVVAFQRGTVDAVTERSLTVKSEDGFAGTYLLSSETRVRKDRKAASVSDIELKDTVRVLAIKTDSGLTAKAVRVHGG
jgi:hypothetical protein